MLGFEQTATGYRATDEQVQWWAARDTCPSCAAVVSPIRADSDGRKHYSHDCNGTVEWSSYSPTDTAELAVAQPNCVRCGMPVLITKSGAVIHRDTFEGHGAALA